MALSLLEVCAPRRAKSKRKLLCKSFLNARRCPADLSEPLVSKRVRCRPTSRLGTTVVELAFVLPVFLLFVFALLEFSHALMVKNMLTAVAKQAAHQGSFDGASTADVNSFITEKLDSFLPSGNVSKLVKDAAIYESSATNPAEITTTSLPNIELQNAESRQLFLVHVEVPYEDVALIPPFWIKNVTLSGSSIMRRE